MGGAGAKEEQSLQLEARLSSATVPSLAGPTPQPRTGPCPCAVSSVVAWAQSRCDLAPPPLRPGQMQSLTSSTGPRKFAKKEESQRLPQPTKSESSSL